MNVIRTRLHVAEDGTITGHASAALPAGDYEADIAVASVPRPGKPFTMEDFPVHDAAWDASISLRREDLYDDEGRLR